MIRCAVSCSIGSPASTRAQLATAAFFCVASLSGSSAARTEETPNYTKAANRRAKRLRMVGPQRRETKSHGDYNSRRAGGRAGFFRDAPAMGNRNTPFVAGCAFMPGDDHAEGRADDYTGKTVSQPRLVRHA